MTKVKTKVKGIGKQKDDTVYPDGILKGSKPFYRVINDNPDWIPQIINALKGEPNLKELGLLLFDIGIKKQNGTPYEEDRSGKVKGVIALILGRSEPWKD